MGKLIERLMSRRGLRVLIDDQRARIESQIALVNKQSEMLSRQSDQLSHLAASLLEQRHQIAEITAHLGNAEQHGFSAVQLAKLSPRMSRNFLPNDNVVVQKQLMATWRTGPTKIGYEELLASGFRVFSQNDEDGVLLRIFSHIGETNRYVIEIGSNCSDSDLGIPENLSTNLIVNHGWHGAIFEIDQTECDRIRYFFARDFATKHFHVEMGGQHGYFSPLIIQQGISPENIDQTLKAAHDEPEPDLMVIDIDGGDYAVMQRMAAVRPRVVVVEFEKRFRDRHSVVQFDNTQFSKRWAQSGAASLSAWEALMGERGYTLCAIGSCGFNAFFVRSDIAIGAFEPLTAHQAFEGHPILSKVSEEFWLTPDETWQKV